jgi:hypothetical protein
MPKSPKSRMEWLTEARDNAQRQIEILEGVVDPWGRRSDNGGAITELRRVLKELNDSLAEPAAEGSDSACRCCQDQDTLDLKDLKSVERT